ncbi:MAG: DUF1934 domain-containing protein [Sporomusaceae bacterium]|jgi:uncharacterized beta-barrel protein YwiB (DUF1934 family)|nr:DUF1934 domain-containing protein [Sporomusaceae bacterium]
MPLRQGKDGQKVLLSIIGVQKNAQGEEERIEQIINGKLYEKDAVSYLIYQEPSEEGKHTTTMLKLCPDRLSLTRTGNVEYKQEFQAGRECDSLYTTFCGSFPMGVVTHQLEAIKSDNGKIAGIELQYSLYLNGKWQSENTLSIIIKEEQTDHGCQNHAAPGN